MFGFLIFGKQWQQVLLKFVPAIRCNLLKTSVILRNEESVSSMAGSSFLRTTAHSGLLQF